ncbi:zinc dependent phospholipase C family protein [Pontibacter ruber]|uniref:Zinc dependent phospholipase C family protein n=1 Tax=Pontibacter ruber TaxID=1343895 RepID=A0ABW5D4K9_9BACT|nr:zinc dependent phospholipase C family protein [Pontibacter ruber]
MNTKHYRSFFCLTLAFFLMLLQTPPAQAYSVLTHQAIIDATWDASLRPLLLKRFPNATEAELKKAHAHAYGGSIMQDMGYFPMGSTFFTDLLHYVRSGDFVSNLISSSENINEYAFALGALAHYHADIYGHPIGTNRAVPLVYPKVRAAHGNVVTYADDPIAHIKTEFGFDVLQVARGNFAPEDYQAFIGFEVSKEVLERAFQKTYGLELGDVFVSLPTAIATYRYTIRGFIPTLTKAAWQAKKGEIQQATPGITRRKFQYRMSRASFHQNWGDDYDKPGLFTRFLSWIIRMLPKVGPLRPLALKPPTPEAEKLFMESFNKTVEAYGATLRKLGKGDLQLQNTQLDTGKPTAAGTYKPTDEAYAELLAKLEKTDFEHLTPALQQDILQFYHHTKPKKASARHDEDRKEWEETRKALEKLKTAKAKLPQ